MQRVRTALKADVNPLEVRVAELQESQHGLDLAEQALTRQRLAIRTQLEHLGTKARQARRDLKTMRHQHPPAALIDAQHELSMAQAAYDALALQPNSVIPESTRDASAPVALGAAEQTRLLGRQFIVTKLAAGTTAEEPHQARLRLVQAQTALRTARRSQKERLGPLKAAVRHEKTRVARRQAQVAAARVKGRMTELGRLLFEPRAGVTGRGGASRESHADSGRSVLPWPNVFKHSAAKRLFLGLLAVALLVAVFQRFATPVPAAKTVILGHAPLRPNLIQETASGELSAAESVTIRAPASLPITFLLPAGTAVEAGELLMRFDASEYEAALRENRAALQVAQADLKKATEELEAETQQLLSDLQQLADEVRLAQLDLDVVQSKPLPSERQEAQLELEMARTSFEYAKKKRRVLPDLVAKGFVTQSTLEEAELEYLEANAALQAKRFEFKKVVAGATAAELERVRIPLEQARYAHEKARQSRTAKLKSLEADIQREHANVENARALVAWATKRLNQTELLAPWASTVVYAETETDEADEKVKLGMTPFEGQALLHLPDLSTLVVEVELNPVEASKVSLGDAVEVRLEVYPDLIFQGVVAEISAVVDGPQGPSTTASGTPHSEVTVEIEAADPRLKPGLRATLDFMINHRKLDAPRG